jgi:hypothetical protein
MDKRELLRFELNLIRREDIRDFTEKAINVIPDYIFTIPASSTGKYHPAYALGEGGLLRHIRAAVRIAAALFRNDTVTGKFDDSTKDVIISALILHDGVKSGIVKQPYTVDRHPTLMVEYLMTKMTELYGEEFHEMIGFVSPLIASHMGQWNIDKDGNEHSPLPKSAEERFVHMCDYLASRKFIEINFDASL